MTNAEHDEAREDAEREAERVHLAEVQAQNIAANLARFEREGAYVLHLSLEPAARGVACGAEPDAEGVRCSTRWAPQVTCPACRKRG